MNFISKSVNLGQKNNVSSKLLILLKVISITIPLEILVHFILEKIIPNQNFNILLDSFIISILSAYPVYFFIIKPLQNKETFQKNQKLKAIIKNANFSIITTDPFGLITGFNSEAERILGYQEKELIGKYSPYLFHDVEEMKKEEESLSKEFNEEILGFNIFTYKPNKDLFYEKEWTYISKEGKKTPVLLNITTLKDEDGLIIGYLGIGKDLSKKKELEQQREDEKNKLYHISRMGSLGELSAGVAHEINNPLAIVAANLEMLKRDPELVKSYSKRINSMENAVTRMSKIVSGLKKYAVNSENDELRYIKFSAVIEDTVSLIDVKLKKNLVTLTIENNLTNDLIYGNECELEQVFINLINNSIDAIKNLDEKWIKISINQDQEKISTLVTDSGTGIPEKITHKLFDPFFTTKEVGSGTGLGLSISKGIIEKHNGSIFLNKNKENTCFEITLPMLKNKKDIL